MWLTLIRPFHYIFESLFHPVPARIAEKYWKKLRCLLDAYTIIICICECVSSWENNSKCSIISTGALYHPHDGILPYRRSTKTKRCIIFWIVCSETRRSLPRFPIQLILVISLCVPFIDAYIIHHTRMCFCVWMSVALFPSICLHRWHFTLCTQQICLERTHFPALTLSLMRAYQFLFNYSSISVIR